MVEILFPAFQHVKQGDAMTASCADNRAMASSLREDFGEPTPLEYLAIADRERIHSQFLCWLLGQDSPLGSLRSLLLARLCTLSEDLEIVWARTEVQHRDLVLLVRQGLDSYHVVFENKLKAGADRQQLERYSAEDPEFLEPRRFFLTLIGERVERSQWQALTFSQVAGALEETITRAQLPPEIAPYINDYLRLVRRLTLAARLSVEGQAEYADVLFRWAPEPIAFKSYVETNRLRTLLQRAWMRALALELQSRLPTLEGKWEIGETRGNALLDVTVESWKGAHEQYWIGLQLQNEALKVFCYSEPAGSEARGALVYLQQALGSEGRRISSGKFQSFSAVSLRGEPLSLKNVSEKLADLIARLEQSVSSPGFPLVRSSQEHDV